MHLPSIPSRADATWYTPGTIRRISSTPQACRMASLLTPSWRSCHTDATQYWRANNRETCWSAHHTHMKVFSGPIRKSRRQTQAELSASTRFSSAQ